MVLENNDLKTAAQCLYKAKSYHKLWTVIQNYKLYMTDLSPQNAEYFLKFLESIPDNVPESREILVIYRACFQIFYYQLDAAQENLTSILSSSEFTASDSALLGEAYLLQGIISLLQKRFDFIEPLKLASRLLPDGSTLIDKNYSIISINGGVCSNGFELSKIKATIDKYKEALPYFQKLTHGGGAGVSEYILADLAYQQRKYTTCKKHLYLALETAHKHDQWETLMNIYLLYIRVYIALGSIDSLMYCVNKLFSFMDKYPCPPRYQDNLDFMIGWLRNQQGHMVNFTKWLYHLLHSNTPKPPFETERNRLYYGTVLALDKSDTEVAEVYLSELRQMFRKNKQPFFLPHLYFLSAFVYKTTENMPKLQESLEKAYQLISQSGKDMIFIEYGSLTRSLFLAYKKCDNKKIPDDKINYYVTKSNTYAKYLNAFKHAYEREFNTEKEVLLSAREIEIMDNLCKGLKRTEIAEEMEIAESTVNSYMKNIYIKLGAVNMGDAIYNYTLLKVKGEI